MGRLSDQRRNLHPRWKTSVRSVQLHFSTRPSVLVSPRFKVAEYDVSQFSSVLLLVVALTLTLCVGVAAWRVSGDTSEVTGGILLPLSDPR